eukprot:Tamp_22056.p1 GENE.Tamp_22056~~Tamp_22056.p1  ORF type:complete len:368 (+),score=106.15 Tamp_22056:3-1106(+)
MMRTTVAGGALLLLAAGSAAFAPSSPGFGPRHALRAAAAHAVKPCARRAALAGLRAQLGDMPAPKADAAASGKELPEITEEMMVMMALEKRKSSALPETSKVMVFGALDRLGQLVVRHLAQDGAYRPAIQVNRDYRDFMRFTVDGVAEEAEKYFPKTTQISIEEIPADASAGILCVESATDPDTLKQILSLGLPLKKFVVLSKIGVDSRDSDWTLKLRAPFLKLDKWAQIESVLKECADLYNFDYTILRVGDLKGGPYYDTNRDFQVALEDRIFDADVKGLVLKEGDQPSGNTGRDVCAQALIECLRQPDAANKVLSLTSVKQFREDGIGCSVDNALQLGPASKNRIRTVKTPTQDEWKKAFSKALP